MAKVEYGQPGFDVEHARAYGPDVVLWELTEMGSKRLVDRTLPPSFPHGAYGVLAILEKLGYAEEDEVANHMDMNPKAMHNLMARLVGFGYVVQVQR